MKNPLNARIDKWIPTPDELKQIETLAGYGLSIKKIAPLLNVNSRTLERRYAEDDSDVAVAFLKGKSIAESMVSKTCIKMATSGKHPSVTMFWLTKRAGWRDELPDEQFDELPHDPSLDD